MKGKLSKVDWQEEIKNFYLECYGCGYELKINELAFEHEEYLGPFCKKCAELLGKRKNPKFIRIEKGQGKKLNVN